MGPDRAAQANSRDGPNLASARTDPVSTDEVGPTQREVESSPGFCDVTKSVIGDDVPCHSQDPAFGWGGGPRISVN
jgi:hypothetical protein